MEKTWTELSCEIPEIMVDVVADFLASLGSEGVSTGNYDVDTFSVDDISLPSTVVVTAYFAPEAAVAASEQLAAFLQEHGPSFEGFSFTPPTVRYLTDQNWATAWQQYFKPVRIGQRLVIKPTWEDYTPLPDDVILHIDPGMAFGTGTHPTTLLCLQALERAVISESSTVLDVGTGSGILAIAAARLGALEVTAIDIDEDAVRVAEDNLRLNGVEALVSASATPLEEIRGLYDVVVANILAEELVRLSPLLVERLKPEGRLVLSGILNEKECLVTDGFSSFNLSEPTITREGEWSCIIYRRI